MSGIRPLRRTGEIGPAGSTVWVSRNGRLTFVQEPRAPRQWFAHLDDEGDALNVGWDHPTLRSVVTWAEREFGEPEA